MSTSLLRCTRCILPETHETIVFDDKSGICNICKAVEFKQTKVDWDKKEKEFESLIEMYRGKYSYDCIVPFSGGKDSTFTLLHLVKKYGLKPLVVRFDHGFLREGVKETSLRTFRKLGVDVHHFTPNWKIVQKLMLQSFIEKGDFCWHCHTGIFAYPMSVAVKEKIPLVIWGEPSSEYTAYYNYESDEEVDEKRFSRTINLGINAEDMLVRFQGEMSERDLAPFTYPNSAELRKIGVRSVCLGSYLPWDVKKQVEIIENELGWRGDEVENVPPGYGYEKIECSMQGVRDYIKYIKRGYTRPSHLASIDIRNHRMTRAEAMDLISKYEGKRPPSLDIFLDLLGLKEVEFLEIALSHQVSPNKHELKHTVAGTKTHDFAKWLRDGQMPRDVTLGHLNKWSKLRKTANS